MEKEISKYSMIKIIYRIVRRYFLIIFCPFYVLNQVISRKGHCKHCGCCRHIFIVPTCFDKENNICKVWKYKGYDYLPIICKIYPIDEKDKNENYKECNFYWEKKKAKNRGA